MGSIVQTRKFVVLAILFFAASPSVAQKTPHRAANTPSLVPLEQSKCEIAANKAGASGPGRDARGWMVIDRQHFLPVGEASPPNSPPPYRDPVTGITFYVESDGRHVAAIESSGKLKWIRNPFVDNDMCPYRSAHPFIRNIRAISIPDHPDARMRTDAGANAQARYNLEYPMDIWIKNGRIKERPRSDDRFLDLEFNSSQFGYLNIRNGDFYFMGQN
jgi:hypothetical protein